MLISEETRNTGLTLGLTSFQEDGHDPTKKNHPSLKKFENQTFPSLSLAVSSASGATNSHSNSSVKRERETSGDQEEVEEVWKKDSCKVMMMMMMDDVDEEQGSSRKKLRLTKDQSNTLEDSFKEHSTLNPKQKHVLAKQLNLRPRQVEVWFQNRRARTKLKQTEIEYELMKKCCETLTDENRRLQKELQDMKAMKIATPFYMQAPTLITMCPSCERIGSDRRRESGKNKNHFSVGSEAQLHNHIQC